MTTELCLTSGNKKYQRIFLLSKCLSYRQVLRLIFLIVVIEVTASVVPIIFILCSKVAFDWKYFPKWEITVTSIFYINLVTNWPLMFQNWLRSSIETFKLKTYLYPLRMLSNVDFPAPVIRFVINAVLWRVERLSYQKDPWLRKVHLTANGHWLLWGLSWHLKINQIAR